MTINSRINIFIFIILICFTLIIIRLFYLQILHKDYYRQQAENQYVYSSGDNFDRGNIYFTDNQGSLSVVAQVSTEYNIVLDPRVIKSSFAKKNDNKSLESKNFESQSKDLYKLLKKVFTSTVSEIKINFLDLETFQSKINKDSAFEIIAENVGEEIANKIISLHIKGVIVNRKKSRIYPGKEIAAKVLGFVGYLQNSPGKIGLYGLEKYYNDVLSRNNQEKKINFFAEVFSDLRNYNKSINFDNSNVKDNLINSNNYGDLNLTLDIWVERFLHEILILTKNKWQSEKVGGIIMNPNDGSIIAMDEIPSFDPNDYSKVENIKYYNNDLISGVYEMGSILKPLTIAAALDSNVINQDTKYNDTGMVEFNNYKIFNYDRVARGPNTSLQNILDKSLNVGIAFVIQQLGREKLQEYFFEYGFGKETGIDLPNESAGLVKNLKSGVMVDAVTAGFGQGIALTPIQTIRALATLANGGRLINPHVLDSITNHLSQNKQIIPDEGKIIFKNASTSQIISQMLVQVVDITMKSGNPKHSVAAKTGTAQIPNPQTGKYFKDRYLHSFFGYFPAQNPKYIIFLYQIHPQGAEYSSQTLKSPFFDLVQFLISYYKIPPDRNEIPEYLD